MSREIPEVVRAAAGLAATVLDEARKLPETLPGLPVRVIGLAMQSAMKVQQQYAGLVARGDELFTGIRGEDEPGMATFDDDVEPVTVTPPGFRDSAFDRAADTSASDPNTYVVSDVDADAAIEELADQAGDAQTSLDDLAAEAPTTDEILDEIAIDELVDQAPTLDETAPTTAPTTPPTTPDTLDAEPTADVATTVDVFTAEGAVTPVNATVTGTEAAAAAPIDGYDSFSVAQLRGRLRGYALSTVQDLVAYEEGTRARAPYMKMLRNRLEKLEEQAIASSPLAPRGA